jgi:acyl carrier protein
MVNTNEIKNRIRKFIIETSYVPEDQINNDTLIFAQGIFDSMGFIALIDFLEGAFEIKIKDTELLEENFESIDAIAGLIGRKLS